MGARRPLPRLLLGLAVAAWAALAAAGEPGLSGFGDVDPTCSTTSARLVLSSERNETGDWVARVRLVHADADPNSWERWRVDAEHSVLRCAGAETRVLVEANLTIPRSALRPVSAPPPVVVRRPASGNATDDEGSGGDGGGDALPEGYVTIPRLGSAYRYHDDWLMWSDARAACEAEGGHLAVPGSEEEYNALAKLSSKHPWVGLFYDKERGRYMTVNDEPIEELNYVRWGPGEPDKSGDCIFFQTLTKMLYDEPCGFVEVFVCETNLYEEPEDGDAAQM
ncbi:hypothetical protein R5R35_011129 [Gryllus longicercus]|uniref:C-type lectin domain-containing protein n=1 Tax=Gryllus longicercus TaxID=2509291 RepID=A0AAN9VI25_9ORTH